MHLQLIMIQKTNYQFISLKNKMYFATHGYTAVEIIFTRVDSEII